MGKEKTELQDSVSLQLYDEEGKLKVERKSKRGKGSILERIFYFLLRGLENG